MGHIQGPEADCDDASSAASEYSSLNELPYDGVPLKYPTPKEAEGTVYGQVCLPPPLATGGCGMAPMQPPTVYPVASRYPPPPYIVPNAEQTVIGMGKAVDAVHIPVVIPRLPLDNLKAHGLPLDAAWKNEVVDNGGRFLPEFQAKSVRIRFLRNVLWIVVIQLAISCGLAAMALFVSPVKAFFEDNRCTIWASWGTGLGLMILGRFGFNSIRRLPLNLVYLVAFTTAMVCMIGSVVGHFQSDVLLLSVILTFSLMLILASVATLTRVDVTNWVPLLMSSFVIVVGSSVVGALYLDAVFHIVISAAIAMISSMYVVYDIQLLLGDSGRSLSPGEFVAGSFAVYLDTLNIFFSCGRVCKQSSK